MIELAGATATHPDDRERAAAAWAAGMLGWPRVELRPVSGDASFRRYFRLVGGDRSVILMDAPPEKENSTPFVDIDRRLREAGLPAPEILFFDLECGFGLLEDFGDTLYREVLDETSADDVMPALLDLLEGLATRVRADGLPDYDEILLQAELDLFRDWYLGQHRRRLLTGPEESLWSALCTALIDSARRQPQVFVHKDFHSCNLLRTPHGPGLIDFQDGLRGPLSYDLASLLWDRYIAWPRERLEGWMREAHCRLETGMSLEEWIRCCDWMGLQRNLKIVGIFARLRHRDGKQGYIELIPRFYQYLLDVLPRYPEFGGFRDFHHFLERAECAP
jgi:aminoglycoside/choline kinase family phosphotransferase